MLKKITVDELKKMTDSEGLILQGCGGDLQEWVDGINDQFTESGILLENDRFKDIVSFEHEGVTNLLFKMDNVKLNVGALAMWRIQSHEHFGGTWLSDYLTNRFGIDRNASESSQKPDCPLIGQDGNIFNLMGIASRTLKDNGMNDQAKEMSSRVMSSGGYDEALNIIGEYVNITSDDEEDMSEEYEDNFSDEFESMNFDF